MVFACEESKVTKSNERLLTCVGVETFENNPRTEKASIYYGPCQNDELTMESHSSKIPHNVKQLVLNQKLIPEKNYILIGEVEKELKAAKERSRNCHKKLLEQPKKLNANNLLEELKSSRRWQDLNDALYTTQEPLFGYKKRPAPPAPIKNLTNSQNPSNEVQTEFLNPLLRSNASFDGNINMGNDIPERAHAINKQTTTIKLEDEYLNASEINNRIQEIEKSTYDCIDQITPPKTWNPVSQLNSPQLNSQLPPSPPLPRPSLISFMGRNILVQNNTDMLRKPSNSQIFENNFILKSRNSFEEFAENSDSSGTMKLLPSDVRKHRIWFSLNPGVATASRTTDGIQVRQEDNTLHNNAVDSNFWHGFQPQRKLTASEIIHTNRNEGQWNFSNNEWKQKVWRKTKWTCKRNLNLSVIWLSVIILLCLMLGFIIGFLSGWFSRSSY